MEGGTLSQDLGERVEESVQGGSASRDAGLPSDKTGMAEGEHYMEHGGSEVWASGREPGED